MKYITLTIGLFIINFAFGQHLYPEKYDECKLSRFCLDCGDTKAEPPADFVTDFLSNLNEKSLKKIKGSIVVQILIDSIGKPCLLSAQNETNIKSKKLKLQDGINNTNNWLPAITKEKAESASVSLLLIFEDGKLAIRRRNFDTKNQSNMKSVGTSDIKGTKESKLSESWTVYNQSNSKLPWDMSRVALTDKNNTIWVGTDNGIAVMKGENMEIINSNNSKLRPTKYNKNRTSSIRGGAVDQLNNKWFFGGYEVYKFDNKNWTVFDSLNSPIGWMRKIHIDKNNNVFLTSSKGIVKYDGNNWSTIDTSNSKLPSNKASGIFVDSKERLWIGTYDGNIRIDNDNTTEFNNSESPLKEGAISEMYEDKSGNFWFDLYNNDDKSKGGMFILRTNGQWESIKPKNSKLFTINDINNFLLDEDKNILWIALNSVGLIKYDITNDKWETYTTENSNVPSIHVMQLTKDENGTIWAATFAGLIKLNAE